MSDPMPTNSPLVGDPYFRFAEFPEWEGGLMVITGPAEIQSPTEGRHGTRITKQA